MNVTIVGGRMHGLFVSSPYGGHRLLQQCCYHGSYNSDVTIAVTSVAVLLSTVTMTIVTIPLQRHLLTMGNVNWTPKANYRASKVWTLLHAMVIAWDTE